MRKISLLLVEALMCRGCYAGPGVASKEPVVARGRRVAEFASSAARRQEHGSLPPYETGNGHLDLSRTFEPNDQRTQQPTEEEIRDILAHTNKYFVEDELDCGACGYPTCRAKAAAVFVGMAEEAMCLPFIIDQAERVCHELNVPWSNLRDVHSHLINSEKLASMGQMAAGVAHELNNPLSTILLYSHILQRKLQDRGDLDHDLNLMAEESARCKKIIGNLLDFARQSRVRIRDHLGGAARDRVGGSARLAGLPAGPSNQVDTRVQDADSGTPRRSRSRPDDAGSRATWSRTRRGHGGRSAGDAGHRARIPGSRPRAFLGHRPGIRHLGARPGTRSSSPFSPPRASARAPGWASPSPTAS